MSHHDDGIEDIEFDILRNMQDVLFGPTAGYIADSVAELPERRRANIVRICKLALGRLGDAVSDPGEIPPRVIGMFLNHGGYVRDAVSSRYWAGLLVCARSANPMDDRAARWMGLLSRLGEYELRTHYLFYSSLRLLLMRDRDPAKIDFHGDRFRLATFVPMHFYMEAMGFNQDEIDRMPRIQSTILHAIGQELLVDGSNSGPDHYLKREFATSATGAIRGEGMVFTPSLLGIRLYLWVFGYRDADERFLLDPRLDCAVDGVPAAVGYSGLVYGE